MAATSSDKTTKVDPKTTAAQADQPVDADVTYDAPTADELRDEAKRRELTSTGTKAELQARLEADDREKAADEAAKASPLLADDRTVNAEGSLQFTADVRKVVDELAERLTVEVDKPLEDAQGTVNDPASGRMLAGAHRLRVAVEQAQVALRLVASAAAQMGQDVAG